MTRSIYTLVMYLLTPVILYRLAVRGLRSRPYFRRWSERFGFFDSPGLRDTIWVHAVSLGEVNAAVPLIRALQARYPERSLVVTTVTPTGSERVISLFGDSVFHVYLPYDLPAAVRRFLDRIKPAVAVIMETEIWPNVFAETHARGVPIIMANARLSERSLKGYRPVRALAAEALNRSRCVAAQTETDATRLLRLGCNPDILKVIGSLKFDIEVSRDLREQGLALRRAWGDQRLVWVAASTHEDDEGPVLDTFAEILRHDPSALLVVVPRHPERFGRAATRCRQAGLSTAVRSTDGTARAEHQCLVVDTMGELLCFYAAADVAFVGGSLAFVGGHNVLEPAALGLPVVVGPNTFNFSEITNLLLERGGAIRVRDADELGAAMLELWRDPALRARRGAQALQLVQENRGALRTTLGLVVEALGEQGPPTSGSG